MAEKIEEMSTREAYGLKLAELGAENKNIVVLDADLSGSTYTSCFSKKFPERFFNVGIAEQNMVRIAAGLAASGKIAVASTFAIFASGRAFDQIRTSVCYGNLNVKIGASHAGLATGEDGPSHHATEDIALMRILPNMKVICPADKIETMQAVECMINSKGPFYLRTCRAKTPVYFGKNYEFKLGKGTIAEEGRDVAIIATGKMLFEALKAREELKKEKIDACVIDIASIKPIDEKLIVQKAKEIGLIITAEDHQINGGLGGAVCEVLSENYPCKVARIGVKDKFTESATGDDLYKKYGLSYNWIVDKAKEEIKNRKI